jgi:hypothetical protein
VTSRLGTVKSLTFFHSVDTSLRRNLTLFELDTGYREGGDFYIYTLHIQLHLTIHGSLDPCPRNGILYSKRGIFYSERGGRPFIHNDVQRLFSLNFMSDPQVKYGVRYPKFIWAPVYS